jgi:hypothetical protein
MKEGSIWFKRFYKEARKMSKHIRFKKIKCGFYRIYYGHAYMHEVYKEMPEKGYDMDDLDPRFEDKKYFEEYEDQAELTRKIKNFVEGYWDSIDTLRTRVYLMRNNAEYVNSANNAYKQMYVK